MCKRTMYKRPSFYGNDAHAPTVVPRPFFLAPAKTAWERGYAMLCYSMLRYAALYAILCHAALCYAMPCCAMLRYAALYYAMPCCAVLRYAALCYAMPCFAMVRYAIFSAVTIFNNNSSRYQLIQ